MKYLLKLTLFLLFFANMSFAADKNLFIDYYIEFSIVVFLIILVVTIIFFILETSSDKSYLNIKKLFARVNALLNDSKPVEAEEDILLKSEYDGIKELDNNLPPWWKYLFYITIIWSGFYLLYYHILNIGELQDQEYQSEITYAEYQREIAGIGGKMIDENNVTLLTDVGSLFSGKEIFTKNCAACHGQLGEGLVGPNLTDNYWIHGNDIKDVFRITKNGVPEKGMISWKTQLTPTAMQEVSSYILSLVGSNPPNQKPPEGELFEQIANN